jgi:5-methyltetrahydrofolate--homocysteine methyltransferase
LRAASDLLLVETIFDSLNAKAALVAIREVFDEDGLAASGKELPVMISAAVGRGGETMISAQTIEAFWNAVKHVKPLRWAELLARAGPDVSVFARAFGEGGRGDFVLSECGIAESAVGDGLRPGAGGYGAYLGEFARGADQYCRRLLRQYAGAHRGDCEGAEGRPRAPRAERGARRERRVFL